MPEPQYDFFATRPGAAPSPPAPPLPPAPGAGPELPPPPAAAPVPDRPYRAPSSGPVFVGPGGTAVNQFGTPVDAPAAPTGPYAAPGTGAVPTSTPGIVSTWDPGVPTPAPYGLTQFGTPAGPPVASSRAAASRRSDSARPPRNVVAVAILAIVLGGFVAVPTVAALMAYLEVRSQVESLGMGDAGTALLGMVVVGLLIMAVVAALLLVGGIATVAGQRWGGWMLVASFSLGLLGQVLNVTDGVFGLANIVAVLIALVLLLVLVTGEGKAWLMRS